MAEFLDAAFLAIYEHLRARGDITPEESKVLSDALHALQGLQRRLSVAA